MIEEFFKAHQYTIAATQRRFYGPFTSAVRKIALTARWFVAQKLRARTYGQAAVHCVYTPMLRPKSSRRGR
jgi:hypothetical protein